MSVLQSRRLPSQDCRNTSLTAVHAVPCMFSAVNATPHSLLALNCTVNSQDGECGRRLVPCFPANVDAPCASKRDELHSHWSNAATMSTCIHTTILTRCSQPQLRHQPWYPQSPETKVRTIGLFSEPCLGQPTFFFAPTAPFFSPL